MAQIEGLASRHAPQQIQGLGRVRFREVRRGGLRGDSTEKRGAAKSFKWKTSIRCVASRGNEWAKQHRNHLVLKSEFRSRGVRAPMKWVGVLKLANVS